MSVSYQHRYPYNAAMHEAMFDAIKQYVGFSEQDEPNLRSLAADVKSLLPAVVDRFYDVLLQDRQARAVFTGGEAQVARQRLVFADWLSSLFRGPYDLAYYRKRLSIGASHVREVVPQHTMITAMEVVWQELESRIRAAGIADADQKLRSLHKLLSLELAVMLESYKEHFAERVRQSERSAVEEKLTRAEHLAEIGQLAASLAHEIKNPLAGISGAIQIMRDEMGADDPHRPIINEMLGQIKRLDDTVKDLLQYARPTPPRLASCRLDRVVASVLNVLQQEPALKRVRVECDAAPGDATVRADQPQIEQLLMNLILNAAHASDKDGIIRVGVTPNADRVRIVVEDAGKGMTPEVRGQAFEAFFTTKAKGTGLGLSICRRIVEAHNGSIKLASRLGEGTTVTVDLPRRPDDVARENGP